MTTVYDFYYNGKKWRIIRKDGELISVSEVRNDQEM